MACKRGKTNEHRGHGSQGIQSPAEEVLLVLYRRVPGLPGVTRGRRADGDVAYLDRLLVPVRHHRAVRRHRHHEPHGRRRGILRGRPARTCVLQRHGDGRGLDERGVVHRHGGYLVPVRLRRPCIRDGLDGRLCAGGAVPRTVPAQVRPVHDSRLPRRALRRQHRAQRGHLRRDPVLIHLRGGADLRRRADHQPLYGLRVRDRCVRRPGRHSRLLVPRRDARGDLDPGGAVHHPDHRLPDAGGLAVDEAYRQPDPADCLRSGAAEGDREGKGAHEGPERARGSRHHEGPRRCGQCRT